MDGKEKKETRRQVHTIIGLAPCKKNSTNIKFTTQDAEGKVTNPTVEQYFKQEHDIILSNPWGPLVKYGRRDSPRWMPAELCRILPGRLARCLLLPPQTSEMIKFAARRPYENAKSITSDGHMLQRSSPSSRDRIPAWRVLVSRLIPT